MRTLYTRPCRSTAFVYRSLALPLGLLSLSRYRHQQLGMLLSANRLVCVRYLVSYSLDILQRAAVFPSALSAWSIHCHLQWQWMDQAQLWFSRLESWSRDSLFKVWSFSCFLIVIKLALVNEGEHYFVGRGRHYCLVRHVSLLCVDCWIIEWWPLSDQLPYLDHYY